MMPNPTPRRGDEPSSDRTPFARLKQIFKAKEYKDAPPDPRRLPLATCVILLEVAKADDEFADVERSHILHTLSHRFDLSHAEAKELIDAAAAQRDQSADLWQFTHTINDHCTREEKTRIIEEIWRVIYADGTLDAHEDYLVHKLAKLLNLSHPQLIAAKLAVIKETR